MFCKPGVNLPYDRSLKIYKIIGRITTHRCLPQYPQQRERTSLVLITCNVTKTKEKSENAIKEVSKGKALHGDGISD